MAYAQAYGIGADITQREKEGEESKRRFGMEHERALASDKALNEYRSGGLALSRDELEALKEHRASTLGLQERELTGLQEHRAAQLGLGEREFEEGIRRFDVGADLGERQFQEGTRRFDVGADLEERKFGEGTRRFDTEFGEGVRRFDVGVGEREKQFEEGVRRFDVGADLQERQFQEGKEQFKQRHGLDERQFEESKNQFKKQYDLSEQQFQEGIRQFGVATSEASRQFGITTGERSRQFDVSTNLKQQEMDLNAMLTGRKIDQLDDAQQYKAAIMALNLNEGGVIKDYLQDNRIENVEDVKVDNNNVMIKKKGGKGYDVIPKREFETMVRGLEDPRVTYKKGGTEKKTSDTDLYKLYLEEKKNLPVDVKMPSFQEWKAMTGLGAGAAQPAKSDRDTLTSLKESVLQEKLERERTPEVPSHSINRMPEVQSQYVGEDPVRREADRDTGRDSNSEKFIKALFGRNPIDITVE